MGAPRKADWREERRKRDCELKQAAGSSAPLPPRSGSVKKRPPAGLRPRLTGERCAQVPAPVARGAEVYGFRGDVWTAKQVAEVIGRTFGVRYHPEHVGRLLKQSGWSQQQPVQRATQWNERRPVLKKGRWRTGAPSYLDLSASCW